MDEREYLSLILEDLESEYTPDDSWEESPHRWVLERPSATKGAIARKIIAKWGLASGLQLSNYGPDGQRLLRDEDVIYQVKSSTMWKTGRYRFQQFRKIPYDYAVLLGIAPHDIHIWVIPKEEIETHIEGSNGQHTGAGATETDWYEIDPYNPPTWIEEWGGTPEAARRVVNQLR